MAPATRERLRASVESMRWLPLGLVIFFLTLSSFVMGLSSNDDSGYLNASLWLHPANFLYYQDWSPLYVLWFRVLHYICPNPVACFFFSWGLLVVLLTLLPTWFRVRSAWAYAIVLLGFPFLTTIPYVSLFGAAILLVGTCLTLRHKRPISETAATFCLFAFITAFARPEFDYGLYLGAAVTLVALVVEAVLARRSNPATHPSYRCSIALACAVVFLASALFSISRQARTPRSGIAFAQHYNRRAMEHGTIPFAGWWNSDYTQRRFGVDLRANAENTRASLFDFFRASPRHFLGHVRKNLLDIRTLALIFVLAFFVLWPWVRREAHHLRAVSVFVLLVGMPCVAASVIIYPRGHYALVLIPSLLIYALQLVDVAGWLSWRPMPIFCCGCGLIWLTTVALPARSEEGLSDDQVYLRQVACTRQVDRAATPWTPAFESVPILDVYFVRRRPVVDRSTLPQWDSFKAWTARQHPAWISVDDKLAAQYGVASKTLDDTLRDDLGYVPHPCPFDAHLTLYTRDAAAP